MNKNYPLIGLIPAAGRATRMGTLPFSKELLPLRNRSPICTDSDQPVPLAIDNALHVLSSAGIDQTCIVISPGKWDIPAHTGNGRRYGQNLAYVLVEASPNVPASLDSAWFLTCDKEVVLLFPDIVFEPTSALKEIIGHRRATDADLVLALVPTASGEKIDIVSVSDSGSIVKVSPKPGPDCSGWTWVAAVWTPDFSRLMHDKLLAAQTPPDRELYVADIINTALESGLRLETLAFAEGTSFDLGTPDELAKYWRTTAT